MIIDFYSILPLTCALFVVFLGLFVFFKDPRSKMNQIFLAFNVCMLFWLLGTFMMFANRSDVNLALFWDRFVYAGVVFMPPLMHHFSLLFTHRDGRQRKLLVINYVLAVAMLIASRTPYFIDSLYYYSWGVHSQARILHTVFLVYFFLGTGIFFRNLWLYYRESDDRITKLQVMYVLGAFGSVIFIGGSAYLFAYGIDTKFPFSYVTGLTFPVMLFYSVSRHHLLDTKVIATEVIIGLTEFLIVMQIFFARSPIEIALRALFSIAIALVGVLLIKSVKREVERREELVQMTHSLERANLRLQELDHQKTEFLSIAAHQLRTPLSVLNGYIELIKDGAYGKIHRKTKNILSNMDESNTRLTKLVDEFLDITRIEQGRTKFSFKSEDLCKTVASAVDELENRAEQKGLKITWRSTKNPQMVIMDEEKVRHVIFNFVDNAIKYSDKGIITITISPESGGVSLKVADHGIGFEKTDEVNFFQKFYRGTNVEGTNVTGTGLGLYVCRKFIEAHQGRIWAKSLGLGKGSEFGFWLPNK